MPPTGRRCGPRILDRVVDQVDDDAANLFGIKPDWFADPFLAKCMLLIVNTWLGYPYFMLLCTGMLKAIPADLYEAAEMDSASPWRRFSRITLPLLLPAMAAIE